MTKRKQNKSHKRIPPKNFDAMIAAGLREAFRELQQTLKWAAERNVPPDVIKRMLLETGYTENEAKALVEDYIKLPDGLSGVLIATTNSPPYRSRII